MSLTCIGTCRDCVGEDEEENLDPDSVHKIHYFTDSLTMCCYLISGENFFHPSAGTTSIWVAVRWLLLFEDSAKTRNSLEISSTGGGWMDGVE